jgi:hypothetical protein
MTSIRWKQLASAGRYRCGNAQWPHVGECSNGSPRRFALRMVVERDGRRVSAAGGER